MVNKQKILLPQEIETYYIIPTLRRYFAQELKGLGMKQKDIATILSITSSSISQYASTKRGHLIHFPAEIEADVKQSASRIKDTVSYLRETQHILNRIRETKALCSIHRQFSNLPEHCIPETVGCFPTKRGCAW